MTTDELRAKFEMWWQSLLQTPNATSYNSQLPAEGDYRGIALLAYQSGYASRDAEVEELKTELYEAKDAWYQANGVADLAMHHWDWSEAQVAVLETDAQRYKLLRSGKSDIPLPLGAEALDIYLDRRLAAMAKK